MQKMINVSDLRDILNKLLDEVENEGVTKIELDEDLYWCLSDEDAYDLDNEPSEFLVGQLSDDWGHLIKVGDESLHPVTHGLSWASSILKFVSRKLALAK